MVVVAVAVVAVDAGDGEIEPLRHDPDLRFVADHEAGAFVGEVVHPQLGLLAAPRLEGGSLRVEAFVADEEVVPDERPAPEAQVADDRARSRAAGLGGGEVVDEVLAELLDVALHHLPADPVLVRHLRRLVGRVDVARDAGLGAVLAPHPQIDPLAGGARGPPRRRWGWRCTGRRGCRSPSRPPRAAARRRRCGSAPRRRRSGRTGSRAACRTGRDPRRSTRACRPATPDRRPARCRPRRRPATAERRTARRCLDRRSRWNRPRSERARSSMARSTRARAAAGRSADPSSRTAPRSSADRTGSNSRDAPSRPENRAAPSRGSSPPRPPCPHTPGPPPASPHPNSPNAVAAAITATPAPRWTAASPRSCPRTGRGSSMRMLADWV